MLLKLILNPDEFFSELRKREVRLRYPFAIVTAVALIVSSYEYFFLSKLVQAFPKQIVGIIMFGGMIEVVATFIGMFAAWLIIATVMHGLSVFFNGEGSFRRTFEFTGYGFLPSLVGSLITVPMSYYYISRTQIPKFSISQLLQNPHAVKSLVKSLLPQSLLYSNLIINLAITLWSLTIWTFAIKHSRNLKLPHAFICAVIPTILFTILQLWKLSKTI